VSSADALSKDGVFLNADCLDRWAKDTAFWDNQPYSTRFYFGDGLSDYIHRGILESAVKLLGRYADHIAEMEKAAAAIIVTAREREELREQVDDGIQAAIKWAFERDTLRASLDKAMEALLIGRDSIASVLVNEREAIEASKQFGWPLPNRITDIEDDLRAIDEAIAAMPADSNVGEGK